MVQFYFWRSQIIHALPSLKLLLNCFTCEVISVSVLISLFQYHFVLCRLQFFLFLDLIAPSVKSETVSRWLENKLSASKSNSTICSKAFQWSRSRHRSFFCKFCLTRCELDPAGSNCFSHDIPPTKGSSFVSTHFNALGSKQIRCKTFGAKATCNTKNLALQSGTYLSFLIPPRVKEK